MSATGWVFLALAVILVIAVAMSKDGDSGDDGWR